MSKVYVTNGVEGMDFSKAEKFGQVVFITTGKQNIFRPNEIQHAMHVGLQGFEEDDYLILAGNSLTMFFAGLYVPDDVQRLQLLVWDQKEKDYIVRTITD